VADACRPTHTIWPRPANSLNNAPSARASAGLVGTLSLTSSAVNVTSVLASHFTRALAARTQAGSACAKVEDRGGVGRGFGAGPRILAVGPCRHHNDRRRGEQCAVARLVGDGATVVVVPLPS